MPDSEPAAECRRYLVSGRVQGVFFRESTRREAESLGLTGRAVNLSDGRVEILACGLPERLDRLRKYLDSGPPAARVDRVEVAATDERPPPDFRTG